MAQVRTNLMRLGAFAVASSAVLAAGTSAGPTGAASPSNANRSGIVGKSATAPTLSEVKARANDDITRRLNTLHTALAKANSAKGLGSGRTALASYLSADITPLQHLNQKIQGDTTEQQAAQDFSTIFTGYRVYLLVLPASQMAAATDRNTATAIPRLTAAATKARGYVTPGNQAQLLPLIDDVTSQIPTATNATNAVTPATVLGYTPAQFNANHALLNSPKSSVQTARAAVQKGKSDLKQIRRILKGEGTKATGLTHAGRKGAARHGHRGVTTTT